MGILCGWLQTGNSVVEETSAIIKTMCRALRVHSNQVAGYWREAGLSVGILESAVSDSSVEIAYAPAKAADGRYSLWMSGEAYVVGSLTKIPNPEYSRTLAFRQVLLEKILHDGFEVVKELDGAYHLVFWDAQEKQLTILNDRFGFLSLYWAQSAQGFAFAGGVRGVLMAPGVDSKPDTEAICEAVTFGGFRLGERTNIAGVKLLRPSSLITVKGNTSEVRKYKQWPMPPEEKQYSLPELIDKAHVLWQEAIGRRLSCEQKPGQSLSGGLDSRAILAEISPRVSQWSSLTWGIPDCDDVRYAKQAAKTAGVHWLYCPLYATGKPDWLAQRSSYILQTDGLVQLVDLLHFESLPVLVDALDANYTGHPGCVSCGTLYYDIIDALTLLKRMPYYGTRISWPYQKALDWTNHAVTELRGARANYAIYEHKFPQAIILIFQGCAPWLRVRYPFLDYALFDFYANLCMPYRKQVYHLMLQKYYPAYYSSIPWQTTGMPISAPDWLIQIERVRRFSWRKIQGFLSGCGVPVKPRRRYYCLDEVYWRLPGVWERIESTIMRAHSISCEVFGRNVLAQMLKEWREYANAPLQVIGSLYAYEAYHRDLPSYLREASNKEE